MQIAFVNKKRKSKRAKVRWLLYRSPQCGTECLATFQTRQEINNDARQHPDTNFSTFLCFHLKALFFCRVFFGVESAKRRSSHEWTIIHVVPCYVCMSTQHVRFKLLFIFIQYSFYTCTLSLSHTPTHSPLKTRTLIFSGHLFYFEYKKKLWHITSDRR